MEIRIYRKYKWEVKSGTWACREKKRSDYEIRYDDILQYLDGDIWKDVPLVFGVLPDSPIVEKRKKDREAMKEYFKNTPIEKILGKARP